MTWSILSLWVPLYSQLPCFLCNCLSRRWFQYQDQCGPLVSFLCFAYIQLETPKYKVKLLLLFLTLVFINITSSSGKPVAPMQTLDKGYLLKGRNQDPSTEIFGFRFVFQGTLWWLSQRIMANTEKHNGGLQLELPKLRLNVVELLRWDRCWASPTATDQGLLVFFISLSLFPDFAVVFYWSESPFRMSLPWRSVNSTHIWER